MIISTVLLPIFPVLATLANYFDVGVVTHVWILPYHTCMHAHQPIPTPNYAMLTTKFLLQRVPHYAVCLEYTHKNIPVLDSLNSSILMLFHFNTIPSGYTSYMHAHCINTLPEILGATISRCIDCKVKPCSIAVLEFCSSTVWCCPQVELLCVGISIHALLDVVKVS